MPNLDSCHPQVVNALKKAGWTVIPRPFTIRTKLQRRLFADIEAKNKQNRQIVIVEVKCFQERKSELVDLYTAIGQYLIYRSVLKERGETYPVYLAVPKEAYNGVFQEMAMPVIQENRIKMLIVDIENEVIEQWLE